MPKKPSYYELLRHPKWQKKRLEIMEEHGFECEDCGATEVTLNVNHSYYEKGLAPWEYPNESLHCLCENCHQAIQLFQTALQRLIGLLDLAALEQIYGYAQALAAFKDHDVELDAYSYECSEGIGDAFGLNSEEVTDTIVDHSGTLHPSALESLSRQRGRKLWKPGLHLPTGFPQDKA